MYNKLPTGLIIVWFAVVVFIIAVSGEYLSKLDSLVCFLNFATLSLIHPSHSI